MTTRSLDRVALIDWFRRELAKVQQERAARPGVTEFGNLEWVVYERGKLLELVNTERVKLGMPPVDVAEILQVENAAVGHFDYTQKLALGAADLVLAD
jgi:hypothetical protein